MDKNIILIVILFPFVFGISFLILNLITGVMTIIAVGLGALSEVLRNSRVLVYGN